MSSETEPSTEGWISLWRALCWMAFDDYDAVAPPVGNNMPNDEELGAIYDVSEAKALFLSKALAGHARTRGRRGVRYRAPVGASWEKFEWFGHDDESEEIKQTDWPADTADPVLSWERGTLKTSNTEYIDIEVEETGLRARWSATYLAAATAAAQRAVEAQQVAEAPEADESQEVVEAQRVEPQNIEGETPDPRTHSGMAGRPTAKHLYEQEFTRIIKSGEPLEDSAAAQARALREWMQDKHSGLNPGTALVIENNIRAAFARAKSEQQTP